MVFEAGATGMVFESQHSDFLEMELEDLDPLARGPGRPGGWLWHRRAPVGCCKRKWISEIMGLPARCLHFGNGLEMEMGRKLISRIMNELACCFLTFLREF